MLSALTTSISGMRATQTMLDVTANNLSNSETPGFKAGRTAFADQMLTLTQGAQAPGAAIGGRNPDQIGNGTTVAGIQTQFTQGAVNITGRDLDLTINGDGFFQLADLNGNITYSRVGAFGFDGGFDGTSHLVDLGTGSLILNTKGNAITRVETLAPVATTALTMTGNLPPSSEVPLHGRNLGALFTVLDVNGAKALASTALASTTLARGAVPTATTLNVFGTAPDGQAYQGTLALPANASVGDLVNGLNQVFTRQVPVLDGSGAPVLDALGQPLMADETFAKASLSGGNLSVESKVDGSQMSVFMGEQPIPAATDDATANTWQYGAATDAYDWSRLRLVPGTVATEMSLYTADGTQHTLNGRWFNAGTTNGANGIQRSWDLVVDQPVGGTIQAGSVRGLTFNADGTLASAPPGSIQSTWTVGGANTFTLDVNGFTGFQGDGVADTTDETGAPMGILQAVAITNLGVVQGIYSNGKTVAMSATDHQIGLTNFANPSGLLSLDGNRWQVSSNSGDPVQVAPGEGATNLITAGALEGSNVDMSTEFTRLIISQRSFQSNSKAFQTADQLLQEANNLIR